MFIARQGYFSRRIKKPLLLVKPPCTKWRGGNGGVGKDETRVERHQLTKRLGFDCSGIRSSQSDSLLGMIFEGEMRCGEHQATEIVRSDIFKAPRRCAAANHS